MILEKFFLFDASKGFQVDNIDDVKKYIERKVNHFQNYDNWISKQEHIELLQEILDMFHEDEQCPHVDKAGISHILYYDKFEERKAILYYDIIYILGTIAFNTFDYEKNALVRTEDGQNGPIEMGAMVMQGYEELCQSKQRGSTSAYGPTLIFTTVLESELKRKFKAIILEELTKSVEKKIAQGLYSPTPDDSTLIDCLLNRRSDYDSVYATTIAADSLFEKSDVYDSTNKTSLKNLILNKLTLNQLLQSAVFSAKAEPSFLEVMQLLFGTGNLNLRNDIAHGAFGYQNYYHLSATGVLYFMMNAVVNDFWKQ